MKALWRSLAVLLAFAIGFGLSSCLMSQGQTTVTSLSPDERFRVRLIERSVSFAIDRNFVVELEDLETGTRKIVFDSPDEGRPIGSERFVWSQDATYCLLLGRHFYAEAEGQLSNGEIAYLLLNTTTGEVRTTASQRTSSDKSFQMADLLPIDWHEERLPHPRRD